MSNRSNEGQMDKLILGGLVLAGAFLVGSMLDGKPKRRPSDGGGNDARHYAVMFSVNEAPFRYLGSNPETPEKPFKTRKQAIDIAENFIRTSEPVKGAARVVDVHSGEAITFL